MTKILKIFLFSILPFALFSQEKAANSEVYGHDWRFVTGAEPSGFTGSAPNFSGTLNPPSPGANLYNVTGFTLSNIDTGDIFVDGNKGMYEIIGITSPGTNPVVNVKIINDPFLLGVKVAPSGKGAVMRPTPEIGLLVPYVSDGGAAGGLTFTQLALIQNYNMNRVDSALVWKNRNIVLSGAAPVGSATYEMHIDTAGVDTPYVNNNGAWVIFEASGSSSDGAVSSGTAAPTGGIDGDAYFETDIGVWYVKESGSWNAKTPIRGDLATAFTAMGASPYTPSFSATDPAYLYKEITSAFTVNNPSTNTLSEGQVVRFRFWNSTVGALNVTWGANYRYENFTSIPVFSAGASDEKVFDFRVENDGGTKVLVWIGAHEPDGTGTDDQTLAEVLTSGNSAGATDIDMNGQDVTNLNPEAYGAGWNGDNSAPTKNDVYDKIELVVAGGADGVATAGSYDDPNNEIDVTVTGGSNFSINMQPVMDSVNAKISFSELLGQDGAGSTLDADLLDGQSGAYYLDWSNLTSIPAGFADGTDNVDDADNDPANEKDLNDHTGDISTSQIENAAVTNAKMATMAANTVKGSITGTGDPVDLTATQLTGIVLNSSETVAGKVELATASETTTGTDNTRAVHPAGLKVELDKKINESEFTEAGDILVGTGSGTSTKRKNNDNASVAPTINEDSGDGYAVGSRWLDTTADKEYVLADATVGAAVWKETTATGSGISGLTTNYVTKATSATTIGNSGIYDNGGNVGIGVTPNASSILDVTSTTKGALLPRMTTTQRDAISTPATGLLIWNTTTTKLQQYNSGWEDVSASANDSLRISATLDTLFHLRDNGTTDTIVLPKNTPVPSVVYISPDALTTRDTFVPGTEIGANNDFGIIPKLIQDKKNGILYAVFRTDATHSPDGDMKGTLRKSTDGGETWSDSVLPVAGASTNLVDWGSGAVTPTGRLVLFGREFTTGGTFVGSRYMWSDDQGGTWSSLTTFSAADFNGYYYNNRFLIGENGELVIGRRTIETDRYIKYFHSYDNGETWSLRSTAFDNSDQGWNFGETVTIDVGGGTWLSLNRFSDTIDVNLHFPFMLVSHDYGRTWGGSTGTLNCTDLKNNVGQSGFLRLEGLNVTLGGPTANESCLPWGEIVKRDDKRYLALSYYIRYRGGAGKDEWYMTTFDVDKWLSQGQDAIDTTLTHKFFQGDVGGLNAPDGNGNFIVDRANEGLWITGDNTGTGSTGPSIIISGRFGTGYIDSLIGEYELPYSLRDKINAVVSGTSTAKLFKTNPVDCSGGNITVNPPTSPKNGDWFAVTDITESAVVTTNEITIDFTTATQNLWGTSQNYVITTAGEFARFTWSAENSTWYKSN